MSHVTGPNIGLAATVTSVTDDTSLRPVWAGIGLTNLFYFLFHKTFFLVFPIHLKGGGECVTCHSNNYDSRRDRYETRGVCDR